MSGLNFYYEYFGCIAVFLSVIFKLEKNYNISWKRDASADYKFFGSDDSNSIIADAMKGNKNPWRYPFCDIFIYVYNSTDDLYVYRNQWRKWSGHSGLKTLDLSRGTTLTPFGDIEMRISLDILRYLDVYYKTWRYVGVTQWYNHWKNRRQTEVQFEMIPRLYAPAVAM